MKNTPNAVHQGRNVKRMRDVMGVKQEALAHDLGMSQQAVSLLEQKETLESTLIEKICVILGVPEEMITHMTDEGLITVFSGTFPNNTGAIIGTNNQSPYTINPLDKIIELYERMLVVEREKNELLTKMLEEKK